MDLLHQHAMAIFRAGLKAVRSDITVQDHFQLNNGVLKIGARKYPLSRFKHIDVIGAGKAGALMARAAEDILGDQIRRGYVVVKYGHSTNLKRIQLHEAGHPIPDEAGVKGAVNMMNILNQAAEDDLILCLISGGGSALLPAPVHGIALEDKQTLTQALLSCGATIYEINAIRKHISRLKGGQMARLAFPASLVSLILSDVIGDNLDVISSGPTAPDVTTFGDCIAILDKYHLQEHVPDVIMTYLRRGEAGEITETPKADDICFQRVKNLIVGSNRMAANAAAIKAKSLGYKTRILTTELQGEARDAAKYLVSALRTEVNQTNKPVCLIAGGETTVTIRGSGKGGRNQELALAAASQLHQMKNGCLLSAGTDGSDGPTEAAGAIVDHHTVQRAKEMGENPVSYLDNNDSYHFFEKLGDLFITGPTHTNVMDLQILLSVI